MDGARSRRPAFPISRHLLPFFILSAFLSPPASAQVLKSAYSAYTNHMEILDRSIELADSLGFDEPDLPADIVRSRLQCGVYEEDYAMMPGIVGEHFPSPWTKGPEFPFTNFLSLTRIPYGVLTDPWSGWYRGFSHGYDPQTGFGWPGARGTTIEWANSTDNTFTWDAAVALYRSGQKAEAYECVGHVLHLLMDLSVPAHVKLVNHGAVFSVRRSGYQWDPDLVSITLDEYELALNGGLEISLVSLIPDLHGIFLNALRLARSSRVEKDLGPWSEYLRRVAMLAATNADVNRYYSAPAARGDFGRYRGENGGIVYPLQIGSIIGPGKIGDRYTQIALYSTATTSGGTIIPRQALGGMCDSLVPAAAEFSTGLLLAFRGTVTTGAVRRTGAQPGFTLFPNFPNPFNPSTTIRYALTAGGEVEVTVHNAIGQLVATLVSGFQSAGIHELHFDATELPSGAYFFRLRSGSRAESHGLLLLR